MEKKPEEEQRGDLPPMTDVIYDPEHQNQINIFEMERKQHSSKH